MMNVRQLQEYLNKSKAVFELKEHDEPLKNAKDAVNYFDAELVAAVYVIHTERGLAAMIVNAERDKMDTESINYVLGYKVKGMADPKLVRQATGYDAGFMPLIGHGLPILFDKGLTIHDYIYGSTGDPRYTVKLRPEDVIRLSEMLAFIE
ncbi:aminoacyl-tRNA deacylase [Christensenella massiliensis]|uniref:YbaK/EbsC family protein n=1 Tax=Christensenella massiliensis TaxID=1805714 RepID=A0AAU8A6D8_9FIRM